MFPNSMRNHIINNSQGKYWFKKIIYIYFFIYIIITIKTNLP